jgi:cold shock CspA family protein
MFGRFINKTEKNFAFIRSFPAKGELAKDYFVHISSFEGDWATMKKGDLASFSLGINKDRIQAIDVKPVTQEEIDKVEESEDNIGNRADVTDPVGRPVRMPALYGSSVKTGGRRE